MIPSPSVLIDAVDESQFGGKAASLARSLREGLPVPPGFALATAYVEAIAEGSVEAIRQLAVAWDRLSGPCAIRSSAIGEDSSDASFAGQHVTVLNVQSLDELIAAVLTVRQSARTESALTYRRTLGIDEAPRIGVVMQRMIVPECAGVMFTQHPLDGSHQRVIEAAWGLGEAVVSGLVIPDNYALDAAGRILRRTAGEKDVAVRLSVNGGTVEEAVPDHLARTLCLTDEMLAELHNLASRCECIFGSGLDIEWAFSKGTLYLLQCRAMTRNR